MKIDQTKFEKLTHCPYCKNGKMYEINYQKWYDPKDAPKSLDDVISERPCSFCRYGASGTGSGNI